MENKIIFKKMSIAVSLPNLKPLSDFQSDHLIHNMMDMVHNQKYYPAIYTHCYDSSGTRLFAAGGPLQFNLKGNYIALFQ